MRPASHPQDKLDGFVPAHFIGWYLKVRELMVGWHVLFATRPVSGASAGPGWTLRVV